MRTLNAVSHFSPLASMKSDSEEEPRVSNYYQEYFGHTIPHIHVVYDHIRYKLRKPIIFLAGDSTLDNKFWFRATAPATNGLENILAPPRSKMDVAHNLNLECRRRNINMVALNCAVEASTLGQRSNGALLPQDEFIKANVTEDDIVVVSVGGNDIALRPTISTILNIMSLTRCATTKCVVKCACGTALPCDNSCCACISNLFAWPCGLGYFLHMFKTKVEVYAQSLIAEGARPKKLLICMLYYLDEAEDSSWAALALGALGYNSNPAKLQAIIRWIFKLGTEKIRIDGVEVIAVPLFAALNGKNTDDYCCRVEPSPSGGAKLAALLLDAVQASDGQAVMRDALLTAERDTSLVMERG